MCFGPDAPTPPDPVATSNAQTASNVATANNQASLNAVDTYNPYGSNTFLRNANGTPYGQVSSMTPALAALLGGQEGIAGGLQGTAGSLISHLPTGGVDTNFGAQTDNAAKAAFGSSMNFLQPQFDRQNTALNVNLTNRGLPVGGEAWNSASNAQQQNQDLTTAQAADQAVKTGYGEQSQLFGQSLAANQLPYQELAQTLSMSPTERLLGSAPGASPISPTTVQPTNVSGNIYQSYQDQLNQYNQSQNSLTNGILGGAGLLLSPMTGGLSGTLAGSLFK